MNESYAQSSLRNCDKARLKLNWVRVIILSAKTDERNIRLRGISLPFKMTLPDLILTENNTVENLTITSTAAAAAAASTSY